MNSNRWGLFRIALLIFGTVLLASIVFTASQLYIKGHVKQKLSLDVDIENVLNARSLKLTMPHENVDTAYHYDFFSLLDQPVPVRTLPDIVLEENPGLKTRGMPQRKAKQELKGKFAVQVSSFQNPTDAYALAKNLQRQGYAAVVVDESIKDKGTWFRVRIDGGKERQHAEHMQAKLEKNTGLKGFVVTL